MSSLSLPRLSRTRSHRSIFREDFDSEDAEFPTSTGNTTRNNTTDNTLNSTMTQPAPGRVCSPTPRDIRRLASEHNFVFGAHPAPRRLGWWAFITSHLSLSASFLTGIICVAVAIAYTAHLTRRPITCPSWANSCIINTSNDKSHAALDEWTAAHLPTIQGLVAMVYLIGMFGLTRAALGVAETTVWPMLKLQSFSVAGLDGLLAATRGSVVAVPRAIGQVRTVHAGMVLAAVVAALLLPFVGPPMVGHAFTPVSEKAVVESDYAVGSLGIGEVYKHKNRPTSGLVRTLGQYAAWAEEPGSEPLPEFREWYVNREALKDVGEFAARAVRFRTGVSCRSHQAKQVTRDSMRWNSFETNLTQSNNDNESGQGQPGDNTNNTDVWVLAQPQLTVWVDSFEFPGNSRTRTTLVFAAINGTIEGGEEAPFLLGNLTTVSAVACEVDIEAVEDILIVGKTSNLVEEDTSDLPVLSSLETLTLPSAGSQKPSLNELLLWFTVSPLLTSPSIDGTQPMFVNLTSAGYPLPLPLASNLWETDPTSVPESINAWTIPGLKNLVLTSIGALAQSTATTSRKPNFTTSSPSSSTKQTTIRSHLLLPSLSYPRALYLLIPPLLTILLLLLLSIYTAQQHASHAIPVLRPFCLGEILKSSQTRWAREAAGSDAAKPYLPNELGGVKVKFGVDEDGVAGFVAEGTAREERRRRRRTMDGSGIGGGKGRGMDERGGRGLGWLKF
ncbi:hypothetical protein VTJ04DRAFT_6067 [Mycothermus thermophilus]|uniref:uncharacterized protein n=1 Tax=Humicola insolens TaxID=85995 RepID=UPI0037448F5A